MSAVDFAFAGRITVDDVPDVRRLVERLHERRLEDSEDIARVAMAAHELLENAVKFSTDGTASLRIESTGDSEIRILTRNRVDATEVQELLAFARELADSADPMLFYVELMQRFPFEKGGLGIARVAAEGEMKLELALDGDVLEVCARSRLAAPLAA